MNGKELQNKAFAIIAARRQKAVTLAQEATLAAQKAIPALDVVQREKIQAGIEAARLAATGAPRAEIDAALASVREADEKRNALLLAYDFMPAQLEPAYVCPLCKDTGYVNGTLCECVRTLLNTLRQTAVNETSPLSLCSFDGFDLTKYPDTLVPELGVTMRAQMEQIFVYCKAYAEHFAPNATSLYLCGYAGLGKTHLALSIARAVLDKGYDVVYVSAQDAFERAEKEKFSGGGDTLNALSGAQLLILDDLGTEYISPYVSACLYNVINTRSNRRLPTIYTSNIVSDKDLRRRYTEKIVSRLLGSCEVLSFCGEDIRLQNK
ncbi:MAG: ATP-binding protein [Ruthenibacterium sp.]